MTISISKKSFDKIFSSLSNFVNVVDFKLQTGNHYGDSELFAIKVDGILFIVKMTVEIYDTDYITYHNEHRDKEAELKIMKLFKEKLISKNITPCIVELMYSKESLISNFKSKQCSQFYTKEASNLLEFLQNKFCTYNRLLDKKLIDPNFTFIVMELCNKVFGDVLNTLSYVEVETILFMILHSLLAIDSIYPEFHHADLHVGNIMLIHDPQYSINVFDLEFLEFPIDDKIFLIPYFGIIPKIIDFGFSSIPEEGINNIHTKDKLFNYGRINNDFIWLMHFIYLESTNKKVLSLLHAIDPLDRYISVNPEYIDIHKKTKREEYLSFLKPFEYYIHSSKDKKILHKYKKI